MRLRHGLVLAILLSFLSGPLFAADAPSAAGGPSLALDGAIKHPGSIDLAVLQKLPTDHVQVSFQSEHGTTTASYTGPRLWAVLESAGGIADDAKAAPLHHVLKVTGRDGYFVLLSTGEIAPEFGGTPAMLAYQRGEEAPGASGLRLVMPGDKRGGRDVRDVVTIHVE